MENILIITVDELRADCTGFFGNPYAMAKSKMVRTKDWKLVVRETGGNELYHVSAVP